MLALWLTLIFLVVLMGPFASRKIEGNLEAFLFIMGLASATVAGAWDAHIIKEGFVAPIEITLAVLIAGALFHYTRASATVAGAWDAHIIKEGVVAPIEITLAVLIAGALFHYTRASATVAGAWDAHIIKEGFVA